MDNPPAILTMQEVANLLRFSKAHLSYLLNGKLAGLPPPTGCWWCCPLPRAHKGGGPAHDRRRQDSSSPRRSPRTTGCGNPKSASTDSCFVGSVPASSKHERQTSEVSWV